MVTNEKDTRYNIIHIIIFWYKKSKYKVGDLSIFFDGKIFLKVPTSNNIGFFFYHEGEKGELYWLDEKEKK